MKIIDYVFSATEVSNQDGSAKANIQGCTIEKGPGKIGSGDYAKAVDFGSTGKIQLSFAPAAIKTDRFCIRTVFKAKEAVVARQNLVESNHLPFALFLDKTPVTGVFKLVVSVSPREHGWSGTSTEFFTDLKAGQWYTADLVYDMDTLAVFIDGNIVSVHAYPSGQIDKTNKANTLSIGTSIDGNNYHFNGQMAALQWYNDEIPEELEKQLDERREHPEWFLSYKYESAKKDSGIQLGQLQGKYTYDPGISAYVQTCETGALLFNQGMGAAFEIHGAIYQYYKTMTDKTELGYLVSDEINTSKAGGKKNLFSKGGIYWSSQTGAVHVSGQLYADYERLGESAQLGWPKSKATLLTKGLEQVFQNGRMYYKKGKSNAFEVHGSILEKFLGSGGINKWGYPVSDESDIKNGTATIGKYNEFEKCTIYFKDGIGAFMVDGPIRTEYNKIKGPKGVLGFPTCDGTDRSGTPNIRFSTFQNGTIVTIGSKTHVCGAFNIFLGRIDTKENEGFGMGNNDTYFTATVEENGQQVFSKKFGEKGGNIRVVDQVIGNPVTPNDPNKKILFKLDVWDSDPGNDDHLGIFTSPELNITNAWGMAENNGVFSSGKVSKIKKVDWAVQPVPNPALETFEKWWGVFNRGSDKNVTWTQFATAYSNVDSETEDYDLLDWIDKAFYELVIKDFTDGGNCFGMSLEAINAYKGKSLLSLPLNRFTDWTKVENEFNIKHLYQLGSDAVRWFLGHSLLGSSPKAVFKETLAAHREGCDPVLCISQNWDFSGRPHCILPIDWNDDVKPWQIKILDPNQESGSKTGNAIIRTLFIDPDKDEFTYEGNDEGTRKYKGKQWTGGRLHYMPYSVVNHRQRTLVSDLLQILLGGSILLMADSAETVSLKDGKGTDLNIFGTDGISLMKEQKPVHHKFAPVQPFNGQLKEVAPRMLMRFESDNEKFEPARSGQFKSSDILYLTLADLLKDTTLTKDISSIKTQPAFERMKGRLLKHIVTDQVLVSSLPAALSAGLKKLAEQSSANNYFVHEIKGVKKGPMEYLVKDKLNTIRFESTIEAGEINSFEMKDAGTLSSMVKMKSSKTKQVKIELTNKLGAGKDYIQLVIDKIPVSNGKEIMISTRPGLKGLDLFSNGAKVQVAASLKGKINNKVYDKTFNLELDGAMRIYTSTILSENVLKTGQIDLISGMIKNTRIIRGL